MPELPEVETTRRGIEPHVTGRRLKSLQVRRADLRWPVPVDRLRVEAVGRTIDAVARRAKYLLLACGGGRILIHLGMSGSLRLQPEETPWRKHDHIALQLEGGQELRLHDPRRFGALLWVDCANEDHPLLAHLGPEPLGDEFNARHLGKRARGRRLAVKNFLMDARIVVGVGNIYASEALFRAGIHPAQPAGSLAERQWETLALAVREVLGAAIDQGGTTLRDFLDSSGNPGYFAQSLQVYQRGGQPCRGCGNLIELLRLGQRASFFCPVCQTLPES